MRICELATELGVTSASIIDELKKLKVTGKTASSSISKEQVPEIKKKLAGKSSAAAKKTAKKKTVKKAVTKKKPTKVVAKKKTASKTEPAVKDKEPAKKKEAKAETESAEEKEKNRLNEIRLKEEKEKARQEEEKKARKLEEAKKKEEEKKKKEAEEKKRKEREEEKELQQLIEKEELEKKEEEKKKKEAEAKQVTIDAALTVKDLAEKFNVPTSEIIKRLFIKGTAVTVNQAIGMDLIKSLAAEMGYTIKKKSEEEKEQKKVEKPKEDLSHLPLRPPVVTVMGHVDHGKTSLLDALRKTDVAGKEAGGITQHIGASRIETAKGIITFLDTPGHEAFTALRARGAQVTDLVVLVVAADDGVMPQTEEAINHAKAAGVPIIVAVNKIDVPNAQPDKVKQELGKFGLLPEEWGGETIICNVSAKTGDGLDHLIEMIGLQAEIMELHADTKLKAVATIIESRLDKNRGPLHSIIITSGTLRQGDPFTMGEHYGKVRAMVNDKGENIKEAGPSIPVELLGANTLCDPGSTLNVEKGDREARQISESRQAGLREKKLAAKQRTRLETVGENLEEGEVKKLNLIIKCDTQGSADAVRQVLGKLSLPEVQVIVTHGGVGAVTETDVMLADASDAIIIGFNIRPTSKAKKLAQQEKIDIRLYSIIYEITEDIKAAVTGMLKPKIVEKTVGRAEVRNTFKITKVGTIAGSMVIEGLVRRNVDCRLLRDNVVVYTGTVSSLRRFKEDTKEVQNGYECGIGLDKFNDVKVGDVIELFEQEEVAQTANFA